LLGFKRDGRVFEVQPNDLLTHAVVLGATGSGKTGLLAVLVEELAREGVQVLAVDVKGDLANFAVKDEEWERRAAEEGVSGSRAEAAVYTPGWCDCNPLKLLPPPAGLGASWAAEAMLSLTSFKSSPQARALLSNILAELEGASLADLSRAILEPPVKVVGGLPVDELIPTRSRRKLAGELASLAADPVIGCFSVGAGLDLEGGPPLKVVYLAHLPEGLRMLAVSLLLSRVYSWMVSKGGSERLKLAVVFDEARGYLPPYPRSPPSKEPLTALVRQGRGFGVSVLVATQNPRDLDYRALSNAGFWAIGLLRAEQDREAVADALAEVFGVAKTEVSGAVAGLKPREFLVFSSSNLKPEIVKVRHALTPLKGPLSPAELKKLCPPTAPAAPPQLPQLTLEKMGCRAYKPYLLAEGLAVYELPGGKAVERSFRLALDLETLQALTLDPRDPLRLGAPQGAEPPSQAIERALRGAEPAVASALTERVYKAADLVSEPGEPLASFQARVAAEMEEKRKKIDKKYRDKLAHLLGELEQTTKRRKAAEREAATAFSEALGAILSGKLRRGLSKLAGKGRRAQDRVNELKAKEEKTLRSIEELKREWFEDLQKLEEEYRVSVAEVRPRIRELRFSLLWISAKA
jgi:hypothetical protein